MKPETSEDTRPNLKPADPRGNSATDDFEIIGSIDNGSTFNAATGKNTSHREEIR